jgi:hypothetical protein
MFLGETGRWWHKKMVMFEDKNPFIADLVHKNLGQKKWWGKEDES